MWKCSVSSSSFFLPCDSQFMLHCNLVKIGCCYCATPHPESCLSTGTRSTCSLDTHLHLNEYDTDCLLSVCVCVCVSVCIFTFSIHIDYDVRVFLVSVVQLMNHSVCMHFVSVLFLEVWIIRGFDWFKIQHTFWVLSFWTHWTTLCD